MRIAIVNDVKLVVEALRQVVASQVEHEVAWVAYDGADAVQKCKLDPPDLLLMDLVMPVMNGVEATRLIMKQCPCPILIVTSTVSGHSTLVFEAMGAGALDVVRTPEMIPSSIGGAHDLVKKIKTIGCLIGKDAKQYNVSGDVRLPARSDASLPPLLVIGASTGGPMALSKVLSGISRDTPMAIIIVQHVDAFFAEGLAAWLSDQTHFPVQVASDFDSPKKGVVLIAGKDKHLVIGKDHLLRYTHEGSEKNFFPSVDVFFHSLSTNWPNQGIAVLLTGMGTDGAIGLKELREKGWFTIAEHQSSCIVYGMPKAAVDVGAAVEVVPLEKIGKTILDALPEVSKA